MPRLSLCAIMTEPAARRAAAAPDGADLSIVCAAGLAAVFAPGAAGGLATLVNRAAARRAAGKALVARQQRLEALMVHGDVLPAPLGQTLTPQDAPAALVANAVALRDGLCRVKGCVQHQITIAWDPAAALTRFSDAPELAPAMALPRDADAFGPALRDGAEALRARLGADFAARITGVCADAVGLPLDGPETLVNLAVLTDGGDSALLEEALETIDAAWPEGLRIRMIGPAPAISFAAVDIAPANGALLAAAAQRLGLAWPLAEPAQVDFAYRAAARAAHPDAAPKDAPASDPGAAMAALRDAAGLLRRAAQARAALIAAAMQDHADAAPLVTLRRDGDALAREMAA